jgi:hypothetical protein
VVLTAGLVGAGTLAANADPNTTSGTFTCDNNTHGTFVAPGNKGKGSAWSAAQLTLEPSGQSAVFSPVAFNLAITGVPGGPVFEVTEKNNTKRGVVTCTIHADLGPGAALNGTVVGTMVTNG